MKKTALSLLVASAILAPVAMAGNGQPITVAITYDAGLLETEDGAAAVMRDIKRQAQRACTSTRAVSATPIVDRACVDSLIAGAVSKITEKVSSEGGEISPAFALNDRMILAQTGQR